MTDDIVTKECRAFQWIGQSIATCDGCGKPIFDHDGDSRSYGGPFSNTFLLKPFDEAVIANWLINEWIDRERAAYLLSVTEQFISNETVINSETTVQSQQHGTYHDNTGTDEEYIEHLKNEIERLDKDCKKWREVAENLHACLSTYPCHCNMSKCRCGYDYAMDEYEEMKAGEIND